MNRVLLLIAIVAVSMSAPAEARNTELMFDVKEAIENGAGNANLLDIPYYFVGQSHPGVAKKIGTWASNRSSRGAFRSDESSCQVAFLSSLIRLQERAKSEGGNAIIDIRSVTRGTKTESATQYRCVAGAVVVHVGLEGTVVETK
jgi:hypothetical protein